MWPWTHVAVGYLLYTTYCHVRGRERPGGPEALVLAVGTILPDLVDKPLAWYVPVLPTGRSLAHSLLVGGVLAALVLRFAHRTGRTTVGAAFAIGYLSHPLADVILPVLTGEWRFLTFLAWPVLASPQYDGPHSVVARLASMEPTPYFLFQLALTALAVLLWANHGYPGLRTVRERVAGVAADR